MTTLPLVVEPRDAITLIRLNRPNRANALDDSLIDALLAELGAVGRGGDVEGLVITGTGKFFCAG